MEETVDVSEFFTEDPITNEYEFDKQLMRLAALDKEADEKAAELKELKARVESLSAHLAQYMMLSGCTSKELHGIKFTKKQRVFSKVEDKELLRQWIDDNAAVDVLMSVNASKLTAFCNEQLEAGGDIPRGVNPNFIKHYVHVK